MGRRSNEFNQALDNLRKIRNNIENIAKDASEYICDYIEYDYNNIMKEEIDRYYWDYSPRYYKRTKSLYDAYKIFNDGKSIDIDFDSQYMHQKHRVDNEYIFHWMFEKGYHGGARHEMVQEGIHKYMLWRTPTPEAISAGLAQGEPYRKWSKAEVALTYPSPMKGINIALDNYDKKKKNERIRQGLELAFDKYGIII